MMGPDTVERGRTKDLFLDFHHRIKIRVRIRSPRFLGFLYYRNLYHLCQTRMEKSRVDGPFDLIIQIGFPFWRRGGAFSQTKEVHFLKDYFYCCYRRKIIKGGVEIFNIEGARVFINLKVNLFGRLFFPMDLFNSLTHFVAFQKGLCLLHGASVGKDGKGVLLLGPSGSGKTHLVIASSERGYELIDDDFTFLHQGKISSCSPTVILKSCHKMRVSSLPRRIKAELFVNEAISFLTKRYVNPVTPVPIDLFFGKRRSESVALKRVYHLRRGVAFRVREIAVEKEMIDSIILESKICYPFLTRLCEVYSVVSPDSVVSGHWERLRKKLEHELSGIPCREIRIPLTVADIEVEKAFEEIGDAIG